MLGAEQQILVLTGIAVPHVLQIQIDYVKLLANKQGLKHDTKQGGSTKQCSQVRGIIDNSNRPRCTACLLVRSELLPQQLILPQMLT